MRYESDRMFHNDDHGDQDVMAVMRVVWHNTIANSDKISSFMSNMNSPVITVILLDIANNGMVTHIKLIWSVLSWHKLKKIILHIKTNLSMLSTIP